MIREARAEGARAACPVTGQGGWKEMAAMTEDAATQESRQSPTRRFLGLMVLRFVVVMLLLPAVIFLAAWTLRWWNAWAYYAAVLAGALSSRLAIALRHPDLLMERGTSMKSADAKPGDRLIVQLAALLLPTIGLIVAGLDHRFGWTGMLPTGVHIAGLVMLAVGFALNGWAMAVNRFFSAVVRIQKERGHTVVTTGPYRLVRHPSYAGALLATLGIPLLLNSWWAFLPALGVVALTIVRTRLEDRTLQNELPGYAAYARHTRFRLMPGVW
jgi:protein-S-isoprenylcysteine O-methyltransferase Ste14